MITLAALIGIGHVGLIRPIQTLDTPAQHEARMRWWRKSRFGMFIHWGVYSIPAGEWNGKTGYGEWLREEAHVPVGEYVGLKARWNPVKFDANAWAKMAKDAGMRYVVITTKHHDGFQLYPSKFSDWNVGTSPNKRDIMRELSTAVRKQGLTMGWYHSIMDWHHSDYLPRRSWEVAQRPPDGADFARYRQYLHNQVTELLTKYGPIGVLWFDGEWESTWTPKYGRELYDLCRTLQPNVIVNNRVSPGRSGMEDSALKAGDYGTPEQTIPATGIPGQDWETCMTMNDHWGYNSHDTNWKSSQQLIRNLVDIASKGGNYLLNVGPRADGTFPPEAVVRLREIGGWMRRNGEAIYDTDASVFPSLTWGRSTTKRQGGRTTLYFHVFDWPKDGRLVVPGIGNRPFSARVLGAGRANVARAGSDLVVQVPHAAPSPYASVVAVTVEGTPVVYRAPRIDAPSDVLVDDLALTMDAGSPNLKVRYTLDGSEPSARSSVLNPGERLHIRSTTTVRAATFAGARKVSPTVARRFEKVEPNRASDVVNPQPGFLRTVYRGEFNSVNDFGASVPDEKLAAGGLETPMKGSVPAENVGVRFIGLIEAPKDGVYRFDLTADDGARLWVDGAYVVNNDGLHTAETKSGSIALAKGWHRVVLAWFNRSGGAALAARWGLIGGPMAPLTGSHEE